MTRMVQNTKVKRGIGSLKNAAILLGCIAGLIINYSFAQDVPDNQQPQPNNQTDNNNQTDVQDVHKYTPGHYNKARTQFDGVTNEQLVSYLRLDGMAGVKMPLPAAASFEKRFDFTTMMWFKMAENQQRRNDDMMYLFSLGDTLSCYLTGSNQLICDSSERCSKLVVSTEELADDRWYHLTVAGNESGSYLLLEDHFRVIAHAEAETFVAVQSTREWEACIGNCAENYVFEGGVREFALFNKYATKEQAMIAKNSLLVYDDELLAYYRFAKIEDNFFRDAFRGTEVSITSGPPSKDDLIGYDIIPNDICPAITNQQRFAVLDESTGVNEFRLTESLEQDNYQYTLSMTIRVNETTCVESNPFEAAKSCNLLYIDDVLQLYFEKPNRARFHFFALKNYYETQSGSFFVPQDQWITIQLALSQYEGYHVLVADSNGNILRSFGRKRNMQVMRPDERMQMFTNFKGNVDKFAFCTERLSLPADSAELAAANCPVRLEFSGDGISGSTLINSGTEANPIELTSSPKFVYMNYESVEAGDRSKGGQLNSNEVLFDGIACNDDHKTVYLPSSGSSFTFDSPQLNDFMRETTLEFWFKPTTLLAQTQQLAVAKSTKAGFTGLQVFINNEGQLICAPLGRENGDEPYVIFEKYSEENRDESGWFHVSCGYNYRDVVQGTLSNTLFEEVQDFPIANEVGYVPRNSLTVQIGGTPGIYIKEVRLWSVLRSQFQIFKWRLMQLDPEVFPPQQLLNYFRLASGTMSPIDMAELAIFVEQSQEEFFEDQIDDSVRRLQATNDTANANDTSNIDDQSNNDQNNTDSQSNETEEEQEFIDQRTPANQRLSGAEIVSEYSEIEQKYVDIETGILMSEVIKVYHTVCPLYTYPQDRACYRDPVNKARITVYPNWDDSAQVLNWDFTLNDSSLIRQSLLDYPSQLIPIWGTQNDNILSVALQNSQNEFSAQIGPQYLREEGLYNVEALITNEQRTFSVFDTVKFTPVSCRWFQIENNDAQNAYFYNQNSQGKEDITFALELKYNPSIACPENSFYDKLVGVEFQEFILSNTDQYVQDYPDLAWFVWSPDVQIVTEQDIADALYINNTVAIGNRPRVFINVTIPTDEQFKLPLLEDVKILMSIKWTNTEFQEQLVSDDMIFQNVMYTIHFAPSDNELISILTVNRNEAIRGDNVLFDASESYISNLPDSLNKQGLIYSWICPIEFAAICNGQAQSILAIPYANFQLAEGAQFQTPYEFSSVVTWTSIDGTITAKKASKVVTWYDITYPVFTISYTQPIIVTSGETAKFTLVPDNFSDDDLPLFDITWTLTPDVEDPRQRTISNSGTLFTITNSALSFDTSYQVLCKMTYKSLDKVYTERSVSFSTSGPPSGGSIQIQPESGFVGDDFTVVLLDWVSSNPPIMYDIYGTLNTDGTLRGPKYTTQGSMNEKTAYTFTANSVYPVQIEITDSSNEVVVITQPMDVTIKVETVNDNSTSVDDTSVDDSLDPLNNLANDARLLMVHLNAVPKEQVATRASYMKEAVKSLNGVDLDLEQVLDSQDVQIQKEQRNQLLNVIEQSLEVFEDTNKQPDTDSVNFLVDSTAIVAGVLEEPEFLDEEMVLKSKQLVQDLKNIDETSFDKALTSVDSFRSSYLGTLEGAKKFASYQMRQSGRHLAGESMDDFYKIINQWVEQETTMVADSMCTDSEIPAHYSYEGTEIGISMHRMNSQSTNKHVILRAFDASYELTSKQVYDQYAQILAGQSADPGSICVQLISYKDNQADSQAKLEQYSVSQAQIYVYAVNNNERIPLSMVYDTITTSFNINPYTYQSNQTMCMSYNEKIDSWSSDSCQQLLKAISYQLYCTCNSFNQLYTGLFIDESRILGESIPVPEITVSQDGEIYAGIIIDDGSENNQLTFDLNMQGYVTIIALIGLYAIVGQIVVIKADRDDKKALSQPITQHDKLFIECVARVTNQSQDIVMYRRAQLAASRGPSIKKPVFSRLFAELHPLISPFCCFDAQLDRYVRFSTYFIQMNLVALFSILYFSDAEKSSQDHSKAVIDSNDMTNILWVAAISGFALLPLLSVPLNKLFKSSFVQTRQNESTNAMKMSPKEVPMWRKIVLHVVSNLLTLAVIALIVQTMQQERVSQASQFCIMTSYLLGLSFGLLLTNVFRIVFNSALRRKNNCLVAEKTIEVIQDIEAVRAAELSLDTINDKLYDSKNFQEVDDLKKQNQIVDQQSIDASRNHQSALDQDNSLNQQNVATITKQQSDRSNMAMVKPSDNNVYTCNSDSAGFENVDHQQNVLQANPKNMLQKKSEARYSHVQVNEDLASV